MTELHAEFPAAADVEQLLRYVTSEIEAEKQRQVVERSLLESRALVEQIVSRRRRKFCKRRSPAIQPIPFCSASCDR